MSGLQNLLVPAVLFFALGFLARVIKSDLRFPPDLAKMLSIYLLVAIGIHGGYELAQAELGTALNAILWAILLGLVLPVIGFALMRATRMIDALNASAIAAIRRTRPINSRQHFLTKRLRFVVRLRL